MQLREQIHVQVNFSDILPRQKRPIGIRLSNTSGFPRWMDNGGIPGNWQNKMCSDSYPHLAVNRGVSVTTQNLALQAILFLPPRAEH